MIVVVSGETHDKEFRISIKVRDIAMFLSGHPGVTLARSESITAPRPCFDIIHRSLQWGRRRR